MSDPNERGGIGCCTRATLRLFKVTHRESITVFAVTPNDSRQRREGAGGPFIISEANNA